MIKNYFSKILGANFQKKSKLDFSVFSDYSPKYFAGEGEYFNNVIVHRCVNIISQGVSHIPWIVRASSDKKSQEILKLLERPNNLEGGAEFFSNLAAQKLLFGNSYILYNIEHGRNSLYLLNSRDVEPKFQNGVLKYYLYRSATKEYKFAVDTKTKKSQILHIKNYNPLSKTIALPTIKAASKAIELHNNTSEWNNNLLKNGARPSGAIVMKDPNSFLSDEQFSRLQEQLYQKYSGSVNSGKPLLLEGGLDWKDMSIHPKDMDYIESKNSAAREIALAFGVPPQLLGIAGDNTYSNMAEARLALWEETIIPLLDKLSDSFSNWFSLILDSDVKIDFDRNSISALAEKRKSNIDKITNCNFMTINEKRNMIGLAPIDGGDRL